MKSYTVIYEQVPNSNWGAYAPDLPGCGVTGPTLAETRRLITEAITFHIEGLRRDNEPVPEPTALAETIDIA